MSFQFNKRYKLDDICDFVKAKNNDNEEIVENDLFKYYDGNGSVRFICNEVYNYPAIILGTKNKPNIYYDSGCFSCSENNYIITPKQNISSSSFLEFLYLYLYSNIDIIKECFNKKRDLEIIKVKEINVFIPYEHIMSKIVNFNPNNENKIKSQINENFENCKTLIYSYDFKNEFRDYFSIKKGSKTNSRNVISTNNFEYVKNNNLSYDLNVLIKLSNNNSENIILNYDDKYPTDSYYYIESKEDVSEIYRNFILYYIYLSKDQITKDYYNEDKEFDKEKFKSMYIPYPDVNEIQIFMRYMSLNPIKMPINLTETNNITLKLYINNLCK